MTHANDNSPPRKDELATRHRDPLLRWFATAHLPPHLQGIVNYFRETAQEVVHQCDPSAERTLALRDLIAAKDNAVRALIETKGETK